MNPRRKQFMKRVDEYAQKFIPPLTRSQVCQVLYDDTGWDYKRKEHLFYTANELRQFVEWQEFCSDEITKHVSRDEYNQKYYIKNE